MIEERMRNGRTGPLHVVVVGVDLDPLRRSPAELLQSRDFGQVELAVAEEPGWRVSIVQASWRDDRLDLHGVACHFVREPVPDLMVPGLRRPVRCLPRRLIERVKDLSPDVVHFNGLTFPRDLRGLQAALPGVPFMAQDHGFHVLGQLRRSYFRWGLAQLHAVAFCAREQAEPLQRAGILDSRTSVFEVVEISTPFRPGHIGEARAATGMQGDPCLLWLGNLDANKDPLMVLDAVATAAAVLPGLRLYMCFRYASLLPEVKARIAADPRLGARVTLLGELAYPDMEIHVQSADFLLQGSHREAGGCGVIEALACGTTPLVTDIASFRRITDGGRFGALVPVGSSAAMAAAIVDWSRRDRPALRQAARLHFERELSFSAIGGQLRKTYADVRELR
jgi:glycosyltransferase involved in cell wall biosynthesis